jgi:hypothetical protein
LSAALRIRKDRSKKAKVALDAAYLPRNRCCFLHIGAGEIPASSMAAENVNLDDSTFSTRLAFVMIFRPEAIALDSSAGIVRTSCANFPRLCILRPEFLPPIISHLQKDFS